jgi:ketosteroid isomerase-like protein
MNGGNPVATEAPTHPAMAVVAKMYECFGKGDMATLKTDVFASDITWNLPGHHPLSGMKNGPDEVIAFFGALMQTGIVVDNISFGTMGDDQVVEKHTGHGKLTNGEEIIFPTCSHYTIKDGKIAKVQVYTGDQHGVDRYFWAMYELKPIPDRLGVHDMSKAEDPNVPLRTDKA